MMRGGIMRDANNIPYLRIRERTWTELMALDPAAEVGRVYAINDWGTRCYFESDGTYWRPHNGTMLLHKWDLSGLSTSQTTNGSVAGFSSPSFPWDDLLAVPGCRLDTGLSLTRQNPSSSQLFIAEVHLPGGSIAARIQGTTTNISAHADGVVEYASASQVFRSGTGTYKAFAYVSDFLISRPADGVVDLRAQTGDTGGTEVMQFRTLQMVYSA